MVIPSRPPARSVGATTTLLPDAGGSALNAIIGGCTLASLETVVRAVSLSPYRAGLAAPCRKRLQAYTALPTGDFPLWLSPSGWLVDPEVGCF